LSVTPLSTASTQINSVVALARALYSASVLDQDTVACLQALQEIKFGPRNMEKLSLEWRSSRQPVQSASKKH
jgi:hypothetical protein